MAEPLSAEVQAMLDGGPTARLASFVAAYEKDDNLWWMIDGGHHQNLFDAAVAEVDAMSRLAAFEQGKNTRLRAEVERLREFERFMREQSRLYGSAASLTASLAEWDGAVQDPEAVDRLAKAIGRVKVEPLASADDD